MKNIHVLPTDKPSRLHLQNGNLVLHRLQYTLVAQHIYITSDEEIKEGVNQWYLDKVLNKPRNSSGSQYGENQNVIILTTDQDLIKDGVLAIDDEFLEWFVKNPSFEFVEVTEYLDSGFSYGYKIIIPKEEPKQICEYCKIEITKYGCGCGTEKPKQETLEELKKWKEEALIAHKINQKVIKKLMDEKKRMYSEEDMKKCWQEATEDMRKQFSTSYAGMTFEKWFEQFKNK